MKEVMQEFWMCTDILAQGEASDRCCLIVISDGIIAVFLFILLVEFWVFIFIYLDVCFTVGPYIKTDVFRRPSAISQALKTHQK